MAAIHNALDNILQAASPRILPANLPPNVAVAGSNLLAGTGTNLLANAGYYLSFDNWDYTSGFDRNLATWYVSILQNTAWFGGNYAAGTGEAYLFTKTTNRIPVIAGQIIEVSAYTAAHRCTIRIYAEFYNSAGVSLGLGNILRNDMYNDEAASGGTLLSGYKRCYAVQEAPVGAVSAIFVFHKGATKAGQTSSYGFILMPYFGFGRLNQTELSPWSDGVGGQTNQITSSNYQTYMAAQSVSSMAFSQNVSSTSTNGGTVVTSLSFNSDGQNVLANIGGYLYSSVNATSGVQSLALQLVVGATEAYNQTVISVPSSTTGEQIIINASIPIYIAAPGSGSVTYTLTATFIWSGNGTSRFGGNPRLHLTGLKR
jgi:hypothetical protein